MVVDHREANKSKKVPKSGRVYLKRGKLSVLTVP